MRGGGSGPTPDVRCALLKLRGFTEGRFVRRWTRWKPLSKTPKDFLKLTSNGPGDTAQRRVRENRYHVQWRASLKCGVLSLLAHDDAV